ncbi:MAG: hypothetical protein LIO62_00785, partial [Clostridiales bacterium]|nr:hypothetical protein [Clostridiales bacterium]
MAKSNKILVLILSLIMALSAGVAVFSVVQSESSVVYAASLTAPSVTVKSSSYNSAKISWK